MTALMERHGLTRIPLDPPPLRPIAIDGTAQRGSARRTVGQSPCTGSAPGRWRTPSRWVQWRPP
jgi:hypothetical protein